MKLRPTTGAVNSRGHALFRFVSLAAEEEEEEPSLRIFLRARFRAKACFTRRLSPGFR